MHWPEVHALVTGGTRGIGLQLVKQLLARGAKVTATGTTENALTEAITLLPQVNWLVLDQADPNSREVFAQTSHFPTRMGETNCSLVFRLDVEARPAALRNVVRAGKAAALLTYLNVETVVRYIDITRAADRPDTWLYFHFFLA